MHFDILAPELEIDQNYILEASAGTGKTFFIEHLLIRLLTEGLQSVANGPGSAMRLPLQLKEVLVVTFTKAATRELKFRIRSTLAKTADQLMQGTPENVADLDLPPYLKALLMQDPGNLELLLRRIEAALFSFETHQIATIHSFAAKMLKELSFLSNVSLDASLNQDWPDQNSLLEITYDFYRAEVDEELISAK
ncbi:MAG: recB, partial [Chlamydiales bacterium]|nr:recB [Chlamydiales bacterium]